MTTKLQKHPKALDLISRVDQNIDNMRKSEAKVARFLCKQAGKRLDFTITNLALQLETSEATISRVCRKLNYKDYNDLKLSMAEGSQSVIAFDSKYTITFKKGSELSETSVKLADLYLNNLQGTEHMLDFHQVEKSLDQLQNAKKIFFMGVDESFAVCQRAAHMFSGIGKDTQALGTNKELLLESNTVKYDEMMIGLSHSGDEQGIADALKLAGKKGASTLAITSEKKSIVAKAAATTLLNWKSNTNIESVFGNSLASCAGQFFLIELLYIGLFQRDTPSSKKKKLRK